LLLLLLLLLVWPLLLLMRVLRLPLRLRWSVNRMLVVLVLRRLDMLRQRNLLQ